jgi:hypothetical protein
LALPLWELTNMNRNKSQEIRKKIQESRNKKQKERTDRLTGAKQINRFSALGISEWNHLFYLY